MPNTTGSLTFSYDPNTGLETVTVDANNNGTPEFTETFNPVTGVITSQSVNPTDTPGGDIPVPVCFLAGTLIATPNGSAPIETLKPGDVVLTANGEMPVRWVGRQTISKTFADPLRTMPVCIKAGALGENLPSRDLYASPSHAFFVDGVLAEIGALVNGISIIRHTAMPETFMYFNIELSEHALMFAEGVSVETFVDNVSRENFDNWAEHEAVIEAAPIIEMDLPRAKSQRQIPSAILQRLNAIAVTLARDPIAVAA